MSTCVGSRETRATHQAELKGPDSACPELHDLFGLTCVRKVDFNTVPPAFPLQRAEVRDGYLRTNI